jgi:hypothetical protein
MALDLSTVQTGMDVIDPTGNTVGTVADIIDVQAYSATDTTSGGVVDDTVSTAPTSGGQRYLKVDHGGILGIGAQHLYIPFTAVQNVVPGESLTVNCTTDTCGDMYGTKPDFLP